MCLDRDVTVNTRPAGRGPRVLRKRVAGHALLLERERERKERVKKKHTSLSPMHHPRPTIRVLPLGAGQEVGRSCVLVGMGGATLMMDCGLHMGFSDARR